jgi:NAD(P)-dependent dehydrogenase (short-subunit alcohol dehydrogenase family)
MSELALDGKVALVTGAQRGIGLATARELHSRGASVVLTDLDGAATAEAARGIGDRALGIAGDVTDSAVMRGAVETAVEHFGGLDVCVANAGISAAMGTTAATRPAAWERVVEVNLLGVYRTVHAALPQLAERRGHAALVGSVYSYFNGVFVSPYAAAKAGVESLSRSLRAELAPHGASAGVAYYGFIATDLVREGFDEDPLASRLETTLMPAFLRRRLTPAQAAVPLVDGIESRAPRVYAPGWLRGYQAVRGVLNPLLDRRLERDPAVQAMVLEADVPGRSAGREIVAARPQDQPPDPGTG